MSTATRLRREVAALAASAGTDLDALWRGAQTAAELEVALRDLLPPLIDTYGLAAAAFTADWYDDLRDEVSARGRFTAEPAEVRETGAQALIGWALETAQDLPGFQGLILGGAQRRIANFSRFTVMQSSIADPAAEGWKRVGDGSPCSFCRMLIGRGAVYRESTADFPAHDNDGCGAAPEWA